MLQNEIISPGPGQPAADHSELVAAAADTLADTAHANKDAGKKKAGKVDCYKDGPCWNTSEPDDHQGRNWNTSSHHPDPDQDPDGHKDEH